MNNRLAAHATARSIAAIIDKDRLAVDKLLAILHKHISRIETTPVTARNGPTKAAAGN